MSDSIAWLFRLEQFGIKFGLENITTLLEALGHPDRAFRAVHIAGTNGKGSVTAMTEAAIRAAGYRTGRYTSPHLVDLRERFAIDGNPVSATDMQRAIEDIRAETDALLENGRLDVHPTFFEVTTAIAFELFRRARVDVAVCEVGLGGRLDATNVLAPVATAITSIGFDHQRYLGDTLREIALEKAGIIKRGVPVVVGRVDQEAFDAIAGVAQLRQAPLIDTREVSVTQSPEPDGRLSMTLQTPRQSYAGIAPALRGAHQVDNAVVAVRLLEVLDDSGLAVPSSAIVHGLEHVSWPGRLEIRRTSDGREALLDAAHNPDGAAALARFLQTSPFLGCPLVFGVMRDKDSDSILQQLLPAVGSIVTTTVSNARSADAAALAARVLAIEPGIAVTAARSTREALDLAWQLSPRIIVAGSIFLLGDVMNEPVWS